MGAYRSIGWVVMEGQEPHKPQHGKPGHWRSRRAPPRIYPTEARARAYASGRPVREVYLKDTLLNSGSYINIGPQPKE